MFPRILGLLRAQGATDILLTGGGILPTADIEGLMSQGTGRLFGPGASTRDIVEYIQENVRGAHTRESIDH
jgi:methylmalonyl-CoA mutase, C-terminal domain